jgi:thiol:disulfide interchange protein DsbD
MNMMFRRLKSLPFLAALLAGLCLPTHAQLTSVGDGGPGPFKAEHLTAELTALSPQVAVGGHVTAGLVLTLEEHWHVYWINAGDSGEPPHITWTLPKGVTAGPMQFPPPQRLPLGPFMDYGYEDEVAFPVDIAVASGTKPGKVHLDAQVTWIICADRCIPGEAHLGLDLNVVSGPLPEPPKVGILGEFMGYLPKSLADGAKVTAVADGKTIAVTYSGDAQQDAEFYPFDQDVISNAADQLVEPLPDGVRSKAGRGNRGCRGPAQDVARAAEARQG